MVKWMSVQRAHSTAWHEGTKQILLTHLIGIFGKNLPPSVFLFVSKSFKRDLKEWIHYYSHTQTTDHTFVCLYVCQCVSIKFWQSGVLIWDSSSRRIPKLWYLSRIVGKANMWWFEVELTSTFIRHIRLKCMYSNRGRSKYFWVILHTRIIDEAANFRRVAIPGQSFRRSWYQCD